MWQPTEEWCEREDIFSFCVWRVRKNGESAHPAVPREAWIKFAPGDIGEPVYMD